MKGIPRLVCVIGAFAMWGYGVPDITNVASAGLVFDLNTVHLTTNELASRRIRTLKVEGLTVYAFGTNSSPMELDVADMPTGKMKRTIFTAARIDGNGYFVALFAGLSGGVPGGLLRLSLSPHDNCIFTCYGGDIYGKEAQPCEWLCYALTYDGDRIRIVVNSVSAGDMKRVLDTRQSPVVIGRIQNASGFIGAVKIWNRVLTDKEIGDITKWHLEMLK